MLPETVVAPVNALGRLWLQDEITVICARPDGLEDQPDLAVRIRGALGGKLALIGGPIKGRPDPFKRPSAFDVLYGPANEAGRPMSIWVDVISDTVVVTARLFGAAGFYAQEVREALLVALAEGVAIRSQGRHRVMFTPLDCLARRINPPDPPDAATDIAMLFRTPVSIRLGARQNRDPSAIIASAITRVVGLAPWHGVELKPDVAQLHACIDRLAVDDSEMMGVRFQRFSMRQKGRAIPMAGQVGKLSVTGPVGPVLPWLWLAQFTNTGSHSALGFGRFDLLIYR